MSLATENDTTQIDDMEVELLVETPQNDVVSSTAECFTQLTSTSDRTRDSSGHQMLSDSDSGESLFITQSVSAAVRTLKRQRAARSGSSSDSDDQRQRRCPEDEDLEYKEGSLSHQTFKSFKRQRRHASRLRFHSNKFVFPFVLSRGRKYLPRQKQHLLENSEIGGFYKWIKRLQMDFLYHHPPKYLEDFLATGDLEDEEQNSDQEVTLVDPALFAPFASARNRHKWCSESILQRRIQDAPQDAPGVSFSEFYDSDYCGVFTKHAFCSRHSRVDEETQKLSSSLPDKVIQLKMTKKRRIRKSRLFIYDTDEEEDDKVQPVSGSDEEESHVLSSVSNSDGEMDASSSFTHDEPGFLSMKNIESYEFITDTDDEEDDEIQQTSEPVEPVEVEIDVLPSVSNSNVKTDATPSCTHAEPDSVRKKIKKSCLYVFDTDEEKEDVVPPESEPVEVEIDVLPSVSHSDVKTDANPSCTHAEPDSVRKKIKKSCLYVFDTDEEEDEDDEVPPASEPVEVESDDSSSVSNTDVETDASPSITHDELGSLKQKSLRSHEFTIDTDEEQDDEVQPVSVTDGVEVDVLSSVSNSNVKTDANPSCTQANPGSKRRKIKKSCLYIFDTDEEDDVPPASEPVEPVEVERDVLPSAEVAHDESGSLRQKSVKFHEYNSDTDKDDKVQPASGADEMDVLSSDSNSDVETDASPSSTHAKPVSLRNKIKKSRMYISDSDEEVDDEVQPASGADEEESHVLSSDSNSDVETDASSSCTHVEPGSLRNRNVKSHEYNSDTDEDDEVQPASGADEIDVLSSDCNSDVETDASSSCTHVKVSSHRQKSKKSQEYISDIDEEESDEVQPAPGADEIDVLSSDCNSDVETDASSSCTHVKVSSHRQKSKKSQEYISDIDEEESDEVQTASGPDDLMQCDADDTSSDKSESRVTEDETANEVSQSRDTAEVSLLRSRLSSACDADDAAGRDTKNESREVEDDTDNKEQREDSVSRSWDTAKVGISTYRLRSRRQ